MTTPGGWPGSRTLARCRRPPRASAIATPAVAIDPTGPAVAAEARIAAPTRSTTIDPSGPEPTARDLGLRAAATKTPGAGAVAAAKLLAGADRRVPAITAGRD